MYEFKKYYNYYKPSGSMPLLRGLHHEFGNIYADRTLKYNDDLEILRPIKNVIPTPTIDKTIENSVEKLVNYGKKIILLYSGGLDSTLVLSALIRYNIEVIITVNRYTYAEAPAIVTDVVNGKYTNVTAMEFEEAIKLTSDSDYVFTTGEIGDQIVGTDRIFAYMVFGTLEQKADTLYSKISDHSVSILKDTSNGIVELKSVFDVLWWLNFNFKYQNVQLRGFSLGLNVFENTHHFFDTDMFNSYSISTIHNYIPTTAYDYKMEYRRYISANLGYNDYLKYKKKMPSLKEVL